VLAGLFVHAPLYYQLPRWADGLDPTLVHLSRIQPSSFPLLLHMAPIPSDDLDIAARVDFHSHLSKLWMEIGEMSSPNKNGAGNGGNACGFMVASGSAVPDLGVRRNERTMRFIATVTFALLLCGCSKSPMATHQDFKAEVLAQLRRDRSDTSKPHGFDFYLYLPTEAAAQQAGQRLTKRDYRVEIRPAATGTTWLCLAKTTLTPDTAPLAEIGMLFTQLAKEFQGDFDGWESEVIKR